MKSLATSLLLAVSVSAQAGFITGNKLLSMLEAGGQEYSLAIGYIAGVHDAEEGKSICRPVGVTLKQAADMVADVLRKVPSERHQSADLYVIASLSSQWPCQKRGQSL
jgi:hypothetical protein